MNKELINKWKNLVKQRHLSVIHKIHLVNTFFNDNIQYVRDIDRHDVEDHWSTLPETLMDGIGDCEDFSIAKFFTLLKMGLTESELFLAYTKHLLYNIHHVVLIYYVNGVSQPIIIDNDNNDIYYSYERSDLVPIFIFNTKGVWIVSIDRDWKKLQYVGPSARLKAWNDLLNRM